MSADGRLFGTDGVRGPVGGFLTEQLAYRLGNAVRAIAPTGARMLVIRDTRESGPSLERALTAGANAAAIDVVLGGVLPTPAAPLLIAQEGFELAAVVSASHNRYSDNGIKFFGSDGLKLGDEQERQIEAALADQAAELPGGRQGSVRRQTELAEFYVQALVERFSTLPLADLSIVLDLANGATATVAPQIFRRLGAEPVILSDRPDGQNINDGCGSTRPQLLCEQIVAGGHDLGFAFDGDGDRVIAADRNGRIVDGDELIALIATALKRAGRLGGGVAVTVMSNYGMHQALAAAGIEVATTDVGDRHVLHELAARGWTIGGEQSGHIIDMSIVPSGDGIASALLTLEALGGGDLAAAAAAAMNKLPQRLLNVPVGDRQRAMADTALGAAIASESAQLDGRGRVLVRASGTEPLIRIMAEAPSAEEADAVCRRLAAIVTGNGS